MKETLLSLHPAQRDVYTDQLIHAGSPHYNIGGYIRLKGNLNKEKLGEAIRSIPEVFDAFRIRFFFDGNTPQCYADNNFTKAELTELDLSSNKDPEQAAKDWMQQRFNTAFVLEEGNLLFENTLIKIGNDEYWYFGRFHHLITDGYGFIVFVQYVAGKYRSLLKEDGQEFQYPAYLEEAGKAAEYFSSENYTTDASYWKEKIKEKPKKILSGKYQHQDAEGHTSSTWILDIDPEKRKQLEELQAATKSGLQHLTIAALLIYLGKTTEEQEFVFGIPIHKRNSKKLRSIVGMFSGILPFKGIYDKEQQIIDLVKQITQAQRIDYRHQDYPIGDLTREIKSKEESGGYLHEISINYEPLNFGLDFGQELESSIFRLVNDHDLNPLQLCWREYGTDKPLQLHVNYGNQYFSPDEIKLLVHRLLFIIEQFSQRLEHAAGGINILPAEERSLIEGFNDTGAIFPDDKSLVSCFEEQVAKTPGSIALIFEDKELTYRELNEQANQLANYLRDKGVKEEELVPLCIERSINMMIAILAVLKVGGAYVPIDPSYPPERINFLLEDTAATICITSQVSRSKLPLNKKLTIISLDQDAALINSQSFLNLLAGPSPNQLAYIIYTSGSTGKPKGVQVEHRTVVNLIRTQTEYFSINTEERILQFSNYCFDASVEQIFLSWLNGAALIIFREGLQLEIDVFGKFLVDQKITHLHATPSFLENLNETKPTSLKRVIAGGDYCKKDLAGHWKNKVAFYNEYGPTETTVTAIEYHVNKDETGRLKAVPIGKPLANARVYILNAANEICPIGVSGELCIGGDCLARGYLNRPELTQKMFVPDPFRSGSERMYRTGDIACWLPDGNILYQGRVDEQVKVRGYRIEPGEIENVLQESGYVQQACVLAREDKSGNRRLIGFVVPKKTFDRDAIQYWLKNKLPGYMVPALWVEMESLPLTSNGKIDKKALPDPDASERVSNEYIAPRNEFEAQLADTWKELLRVDKVGINDNFFELGGHSLHAIQLTTRLHKMLNIKIDIGTIFNNPTISKLAQALMLEKRSGFAPIEHLPLQEYYPLSHAQERFWILSHFKDGSEVYNVSSVFKLEGKVNMVAFEEAFNSVIERHEILRTVFQEIDGTSFQKILTVKEAGFKVESINFSNREDSEGFIKKWLQEDARHSFDLSKGPLLRATIFKEGAEKYTLAFNIHHIISDGLSKEIFIKDFLHFYKKYAGNIHDELPPLPIQYKDYAAWHSASYSAQGAYWRELYKEAVPVLNFPLDFERPKVLSFFGAMLHVGLPASLTDQLRKMAVAQNMSLNNLFFALYGLLVARYSGQKEVVIGSLSAGRSHIDLENLIGVFINFLPVKITPDPEQKLQDYLSNTNNALSLAYNNQDYPFDMIVEDCIKQRDVSRNPFFDTMLNFHLQNNIQGNGNSDLWAESGITIKPDLSLQEELFQSVLDFKLDIEPAGNTFDLYLSYNTKLFTEASMSLFLNDFVELLTRVVTEPENKLGEYGQWKSMETADLDESTTAPIPLNICASFVIEPVQEFIEYWSNELELGIAVSFAPYNQVFQQLLNGGSLLNKNKGINALFIRLEDWLREKQELTPLQQVSFLDDTYAELTKAIAHFTKKSFVPSLIAIVPVLNSATASTPVGEHISRLNKELEIALNKLPAFYLLDLNNVASLYNVEDLYDAETDKLGHLPFTEEFYAAIGTFLARKVSAFKGPNYKVLALDCDNTLWKGIVGELGAMEVIIDDSFTALQEFFIQKYNEGFLLTLCSKNNEADVWEVFDQHPGMKLKREHIAAHRLNWEPKPDNLLSISRELNLGMNSIVFIDDNQFEIEQMSLRAPEVLSLILPEDEDSFESFLNHIWAFDYFRITEEDTQRNQLYKVEKQRQEEQEKYGSAEDFLQSLNLQVNFLPLNETHTERAVQLTMRTNQFNINGVRKTPADIAEAMKKNTVNWVIDVKDRFGNYGIVGLVLAKENGQALVIETFLLSCRVLGRNVEDSILAELQKHAANNGLNSIKALFTVTPKNKPFQEFLTRTQWLEDAQTGTYDKLLKAKEIIIDQE